MRFEKTEREGGREKEKKGGRERERRKREKKKKREKGRERGEKGRIVVRQILNHETKNERRGENKELWEAKPSI